ncbi:MAG: amidohydrolase [Gemmatimonas sp. SG8_38_2]|nr:MAG: amidohydrolase [Gemmatimonas sp. SG8_38_2]
MEEIVRALGVGRRVLVGALFAGAFALVAGCAAELEDSADLVLRNGKVVTVDPAVPDGEAIAVQGDKILAVGSDAEIAQYIGSGTKVIDLEGQLAIPGFIDAHGHFLGVGDAKMQLDLMNVANWDEIVGMVEYAASDVAPGALIRGRGWHQEKWDEEPPGNVEGLPTHHTLSAVSPDNPVILRHASGHASFANAKAMEMAGITNETPDPPGGEIVRDANGEPIGAFRERAQGLLSAAAENAEPPDPRRQAELAAEEALSKGVTSFHDAGVSFETVDLYKAMVDDGALGVRLWVMIRQPNDRLAELLPEYRMVDYGDHRLTVRAIKVSVDGALGPHGAWLLEPYSDLPTSVGLNTSPIDDLHETARIAMENNFQLCVHAIGDRANREVLDVFQAAFEANPARADLRWRIEHSQHLHPDDITRFGELGVIAAMQGIHCTSDGPWVVSRLGEQRAREGAYVWRDLWDTGAVIANGTDAPVEDVDPIASYYATVTRVMKDGNAFFPEQRLTRMEALETYTSLAAYAGFEEDVVGTLTPGKLADITVLSQDILTIPDDEIPTTEVVYTIVGGKVMYQRGAE